MRNNSTTTKFFHVFFIMVFLLISSWATICFAEGPTSAEYGVVLNLSGKQRMLSQKMSKEIMLVALGFDAEANLKNLDTTSKLFDKTLKGLRDGDASLKLPPTVNKRIIKQLDKTKAIWIDFYALIQKILEQKQITKEQVGLVAQKNLPLLKEMNKCVKRYEKDASKAGLKADPGLAVTINLSGKQRMLTQKMSKEFLLVANGYEIEDNKLNLLETHTLFERTLQGLLDGDSTLDLPGTKNKEIRDQLAVVQGLWESFKPIVSFGSDPKTTTIPDEKIKELATNNLPLLKEMNKAVGMYEKEAAK